MNCCCWINTLGPKAPLSFGISSRTFTTPHISCVCSLQDQSIPEIQQGPEKKNNNKKHFPSLFLQSLLHFPPPSLMHCCHPGVKVQANKNPQRWQNCSLNGPRSHNHSGNWRVDHTLFSKVWVMDRSRVAVSIISSSKVTNLLTVDHSRTQLWKSSGPKLSWYQGHHRKSY